MRLKVIGSALARAADLRVVKGKVVEALVVWQAPPRGARPLVTARAANLLAEELHKPRVAVAHGRLDGDDAVSLRVAARLYDALDLFVTVPLDGEAKLVPRLHLDRAWDGRLAEEGVEQLRGERVV